MRFIKFLLCSVLLCTLTACNDDNDSNVTNQLSFKYNNLNGVTVRHFLQSDNQLLLASSAGIYKQDDEVWQRISPEQWDVFDIESVGTNHYLASIQTDGAFYLAESLNGGQSWQLIENNFGRDTPDNPDYPAAPALAEKIFALTYDSSQHVLYATGNGALARSFDDGRNWQLVSGFYQAMARDMDALTIAPSGQQVWFSGQGAIENSVLNSFDLNSNETTSHRSLTDILSEPATIKSVRFVPGKPQQIIATGEPGMQMSTDGGANWQPLYVNHESLFYFDVLINPNNSNEMFSARWRKRYDEPQPFILEYSRDAGKSWIELPYQPSQPIFGGSWSMHADFGADKTVLYFGLFKGGIMQVTLEKTN